MNAVKDRISDPLEILTTRFHDSVIFFMDRMVNPPAEGQTAPDAVLVSLARSLRRIFLSEALLLLWESGGHPAGAARLSKEGVASLVCSERARSDVNGLPAEQRSEHVYEPLHITWYGPPGDVCALRIAAASDRDAEVLWLVRQTGKAASREWSWFVTYLRGIKSLYCRVQALLHTQEAACRRQADLHAQVRSLIHDPSPDTLSAGLGLLKHLASGGSSELHLFQEVAIFFLQEVLGTGWKVNSGTDVMAAALKLCEGILDGDATERPGADAADTLDGLRSVSRCLKGLCEPGKAAPGRGMLKDGTLDLLPRWTEVHELWRPLLEGNLEIGAEARELWTQAREATLPRLSRYLADLYQDHPASEETVPARSVSSVRNLHVLNFCLHLLRQEDDAASDRNPGDQIRLRTDLAYVLRESLRFACFGHRPDYFFNTVTYAEALQTLIVHHAYQVAGLTKRQGLSSLLDLIRNEGGVNRLFAAEHLQHVVEIYMAGHFMLSMRLGSDQGLSLAEAMASADARNPGAPGLSPAEVLAARDRPAQAKVRRYLRAFSLAALFHDVDHLFVPWRRSLASHPAVGTDEDVRHALDALSVIGCEAAQRMASAWIEEILGGGYLDESDEKLRSWITEQKTKGVRHGLFSAWYLHRHCHATDPEAKETLRMAVRAVLLHNCISSPVDAEKDPVATLLLISDEIFEWDPWAQVTPSATGRSLHNMGTSVPAHEPQDSLIHMDGLRLTAQEDGVIAWLQLPPNATATWPTVRMTLQIEERLNVPVYLLWLRKARNLGRVRPSSLRLGPLMIMKSLVGKQLQGLKLTNHALLTMLTDDRRINPNFAFIMDEWIRELRHETSPDKREETVYLGPMTTSGIQEACFRDLYAALEQGAEKILEERKLRRS